MVFLKRRIYWFWHHPRGREAAIVLAFVGVIAVGTTLGLVVSGSNAAGSSRVAKLVSNGQTLTGQVVTVTTSEGDVRTLVRYRTKAGRVRYVSTTAPGVTLRSPGATVTGPGKTATEMRTVTERRTVTTQQTVTEQQTVTQVTTVVVTETTPAP